MMPVFRSLDDVYNAFTFSNACSTPGNLKTQPCHSLRPLSIRRLPHQPFRPLRPCSFRALSLGNNHSHQQFRRSGLAGGFEALGIRSVQRRCGTKALQYESLLLVVDIQIQTPRPRSSARSLQESSSRLGECHVLYAESIRCHRICNVLVLRYTIFWLARRDVERYGHRN